ncbi:MAG: hypothetical protein A3J48_00745 [Candidatus Doudnabacteria bacterium RIFCSPHIGHO2_02_FULL_46_11]|uniref:Uncharacterized protein n=1 Tax=Candidatus Doudnabacteria bacterium RIFCSPHIGHO2_02_FULL_46_11 TaxID=1817832 RepID=A0A1F5P891_9BACT|nr:MAG: hypothetical protein A3J48_00745 [Candidatus Doudnabacteria bacterium RIFCSPHIGHO2_02_FULL_46_11]
MSEINLLENQLAADASNRYRRLFNMAKTGLVVILLLMVLAGGGFLIFARLAEESRTHLEQTIKQRKVQLESATQERRDNSVRTQARLQYMDTLLGEHLYSTKLLETLSATTLSGIRFEQLGINAEGVATLSGKSNTFDTAVSFSKKLGTLQGIKQVVLNSISLSNEAGEGEPYSFSMNIYFDTVLLRTATP